jgi:hypothetical protein
MNDRIVSQQIDSSLPEYRAPVDGFARHAGIGEIERLLRESSGSYRPGRREDITLRTGDRPRPGTGKDSRDTTMCV